MSIRLALDGAGISYTAQQTRSLGAGPLPQAGIFFVHERDYSRALAVVKDLKQTSAYDEPERPIVTRLRWIVVGTIAAVVLVQLRRMISAR